MSKLRLTTVALEATRSRLAVKVALPPFSLREEGETERLTSGTGSLSVSVMLTRCVPFSLAPLPPETPAMSTSIASEASVVLSSIRLSVTLPDKLPPAIVMFSETL